MTLHISKHSMKTLSITVIAAAALFLSSDPLPAYERLQGPTEALYWNKTNAYAGYTFFGVRSNTYLINMEGRVMHTWPVGTNPRLLTNGNVLDAAGGDVTGFTGLKEVDWSGNTVWQCTEARTNYAPHHDFLRIYNPKLGTNTTLYIAAKTISSNACVAAGCNPANGPYTNAQVDAIVEVDMSGNVVWEWCFFDHAIQDFDVSKSNYVGAGKSISNYPGRLNLNLPGRPVTNDWLRCNSIDYNQTLDQIVINAAGGEFYVIDHGNTFLAGNPTGSIALAASTNGDFLYRFGDPARYSQGNPPSIQQNWTTSTTGNKQMGGSSHAQWIATGSPGAGQFLVFNNGGDLFETTPQSYIFQINGYLNATTNDTGTYVNPPAAGYNNWAAPGHDTDKRTKSMSRQITWMYYSMANQGMFSHLDSSVQRLPNGNTLVCDSTEGHIFEVTATGDAVWEYVNPVSADGIITYKRDNWPMHNTLFRAYRYATNHLAFTGRILTPQSTITGESPSYISAPTISGTTITPAVPTAASNVWVTSLITNSRGVASATLTYIVGGVTNTVAMLEDGLHQDGTAGDGVYGGQIPAFASGTNVSYYISAQDEYGLTSADPATAPSAKYSYTVQTQAVGSWTMLKLPDTSQTNSYTATFGEDSDYSINPPSFTDNGDGTVTDNVTGLIWQKADGGEMAWSNAVLYGQTNRVGGQSDWRLPTSHEAFSILNHGTVNPALNTAFFTLSTAQYWWTADSQVGDSSRIWAINAGGGIGAHRQDETISAGGTNRYHVRCVRGVALSSQPVHHFTNNLDGTVTDLDTGLTWQQAAGASAASWESALQYAESLSLAGRSDWRLPNIKELQSINDETRSNPSVDTNFFLGANSSRHWSSTTVMNLTNRAWNVDFQLGLVSYEDKLTSLFVRCVRGGVTNSTPPTNNFTAQFVQIPPGQYQMGDHFGFVDPAHPSDEVPVHTVAVDSFYMGTTLLTCLEYVQFLNSALSQGLVEVRSNYVYGVGETNIYCDTYGSDTNSRIQWSGSDFSIRDNRELHPITGMRWFGAIAYCNWASARDSFTACYNLVTGDCTLTNNGYRLPTEAEWEYAARGGLYNPYGMFPWGSDTNADGTLANWAGTTHPYATGSYPWTTPVGFYNGSLQYQTNFNWPGTNVTYQTRNNTNGFGLSDMSGNVWEWVNDWYASDYYTDCVRNNLVTNPPGPLTGSPMPDGRQYRGLRGGNWFNGQDQYGHARVANRNPSYFRGPGDPNGPWFHIGFRVMRRGYSSVVAAGATLTNLTSGLHFTEGPAADATGNVFFSDITADTIYKWSVLNQLSVFRTNSGGANGLFFDGSGNLLACEGDNGRVVSITPQGTVTIVASNYAGLRFNEPNDLWIDPAGGVYFTDPVYFGHTVVQGGEYVYYISPDRTTVVPVVTDLVRPNGLVGTPDGLTLYLADWGATNVFRYTINANGTLTNKTLFARVKCDGMTLDAEGNLYFCENAILVYDSTGNQVEQIAVPERPTNLEFGGSDRKTLFITTDAGSLYSIRMRVQGVTSGTVMTNQPPVITSVAITPASPTTNDTVWVTARVTDDVSVANVALTYSTGTGGGAMQTNSAFLETMGAIAAKPWSGIGANYAWTVTGNSFEQRAGANYGAGNTNGLEFKSGTTNLTDSMVATTNSIDARGNSGFVEFWMQTLTISNQYNNAGWTFQLDSGSGYVTRLSELTSTNHGWNLYHYDLQGGELVTSLKMRFQFRGGSTESRMDLDQISVKVVTSGGSTFTNVSMLDDGAHHDGAAGDGTYGVAIPALPAGTAVSFYLTAVDNLGATTLAPDGAPGTAYSYNVQSASTDQTVGLFLNSSSAWPGYTLMAPMHHTNTYLLNNAGEVVHMWTSTYEPGRSAYLMTNGHMFRAGMVKQGGPSTGGGEGGRIEEYDWNGNLVWAIDYYSPTYIHHHDFKVLPNGNVLMLVAEKKTLAEVIAAGFNTNLLDPSIFSQGYMLPDCLVEVTPTRPNGGTVVWEWHLWDHMIQDYDPTKNNYGVVANHPERIDVNGTGMKIPQFWNHVNGIDHNAQLDQVMLSIRGNSEVFVIDHQTTTAQAAGTNGGRYSKGGDILYRWGNPAQYNRGTSANQQLFQQHHTHWIETNCPGAGNILIFNNGIGRGYSTINEIVPPADAAGNYSIATGAAFGPSTPVWTYVSSPPPTFYSAEISGAQRLPNGNTLICEGIKGNLFEVTSAGQTVWHYVCPVTSTIMTQGDSIPVDPARTDQFMNAVFRVSRYGTNYAGLVGRNLSPTGPIEIYAAGLGWPVLDITTTNTTVSYDVTTRAIAGTNNLHVVGTMTWSNALTGNGGTLSASSSWQVSGILLGVGANLVTVWGTNASGTLASDSVIITRGAATVPAAEFTATPTNGGAPLAVTFIDTSAGGITNRFWSFGDGASTNTSAAQVMHTYRFPGTNTVRLIVSGPYGFSTNTQDDLIIAVSLSTLGDGIPDWWRAQHFGGSGTTTNAASCATCDPDIDGADNYGEYIADTDPTNALSCFRIESLIQSCGVAVLFLSSPNRTYTLYARTNLSLGAWSLDPSQVNVVGNGGILTLTNSAPGSLQRFFRLGVQLP